MPRRVVRALQLNDSDNLSENYWTLRNGIYDKRFDVTECSDVIYALKEPELVYLYHELVHSKLPGAKWVKLNTVYMKELLLDEFMNRKYKRGRYKDGKRDINA